MAIEGQELDSGCPAAAKTAKQSVTERDQRQSGQQEAETNQKTVPNQKNRRNPKAPPPSVVVSHESEMNKSNEHNPCSS
jgi:hypothetical protein